MRIRLEHGSRSRQPPASPVHEAAQLRAVRQLGDFFREQCACLGKSAYKHYEGWLWAARADCPAASAAPVPVIPQPSAAARKVLCAKLVKAGTDAESALAACEALGGCAERLAAELAQPSPAPAAAAEVSVSRTLAPRGADKAPAEEEPRLLQLACAGEAVLVAEAHLAKLWALWRARRARQARLRARKQRPRRPAGDGEEAGVAADAAATRRRFLRAAFCALARLLALQGGRDILWP